MPSNSSEQKARTILLIAASRGLGLVMAEQFLIKTGKYRDRGWETTEQAPKSSGESSSECNEV